MTHNLLHPVEASSALKAIYNERYSGRVDKWSMVNPERCQKIVGRLLTQLQGYGLNSPYAGRSMLDVGCAKGYFTDAFRSHGFDAFGLDYSDVAIELARARHGQCRFVCADGFNPSLDARFGLVFMRGFSGCNSYDIGFLSELLNRYVALLNPGGFLVVAYASDFSGCSQPDETANWSHAQIDLLCSKVDASRVAVLFPERDWRVTLKHMVARARGRRSKSYFYLALRKREQ